MTTVTCQGCGAVLKEGEPTVAKVESADRTTWWHQGCWDAQKAIDRMTAAVMENVTFSTRTVGYLTKIVAGVPVVTAISADDFYAKPETK